MFQTMEAEVHGIHAGTWAQLFSAKPCVCVCDHAGVRMYMRVHMHTCTRMHTLTHTCKHMHTHLRERSCVRARARMHTSTRVCTCVQDCACARHSLYTRIGVCTWVCMYVWACEHTCACVYVYVCMRASLEWSWVWALLLSRLPCRAGSIPLAQSRSGVGLGLAEGCLRAPAPLRLHAPLVCQDVRRLSLRSGFSRDQDAAAR